MKKLLVVSTAIVFALSAGAASACPKGTHMEGGKGPKHKGGKCVAAMKMDAKPTAMKMDAKPMPMTMAAKS